MNPIVPTPPAGDSSNRAASSQFVASTVVAAITTAIASALATTTTNFISGIIGTPLLTGYRVVEYLPFPATLNLVVFKLATGTLTAVVQINATAISTVAVGTAQVSAIISASNTATTGAALIFTVVGTASGPTDLSYMLRYTRTLT